MFDFVAYLTGAMNYRLEKLKGDMVNVHFKYYCFLMHILLSVGYDNRLWPDGLCIRAYDKVRVRKPMQLWLSEWDQRYNNSQYYHFKEFFVKTLYKLLGNPCNHSISL